MMGLNMTYTNNHHARCKTFITDRKIRGDVKKVVVSGGVHYKVVVNYHILLGDFFCFESPDMEKLIFFPNNPFKIIECLYRKSA